MEKQKLASNLFYLQFTIISCSPLRFDLNVKGYIRRYEILREPVKNYLADFVKGVPPPPTPLTDNHFSKKTIADRGGTPPPP